MSLLEFLRDRIAEDAERVAGSYYAAARVLSRDGLVAYYADAEDSAGLRSIASLYANHPDYREEWKP